MDKTKISQPPVPVPSPDERFQALIRRSKIEIDLKIPIKRYISSSKQMVLMARTHMNDGQIEKAFMLYHKYVDLMVTKIKQHSQYSEIAKDQSIEDKERVRKVLDMLESLKGNLMLRYKKEYDNYLSALEKYNADLKLYHENQKALSEKRTEEITRARLERFQQEIDERMKRLQSTRKTDPKAAPVNLIPSHIDIDNIPEVSLDGLTIESSSDGEGDSDNEFGPEMPPPSPKPSAPPMPTIPDRSTKPVNYSSTESDSDELATLVVPLRAIAQSFMRLAEANTSKSIETCAILAGKLSHNAFTITHLLVPKQTGTSDTCAATNEEELFIEQEKHDLLTLGWIHTHPTQQSFLSSVDLHTHAPYQKMLPEAIAIVVAPKFGDIGIFSLSEYGLEFILKCKLTGFHPHPNESQIYGRAGHIVVDDSLRVEVKDFR